MSDVHVMPDVERMVIDLLGDHPAIGALTASVSAMLATRPVWPALTVVRLGGAPLSYLASLATDRARIQCEAWGDPTRGRDGRASASTLCRVARAVMLGAVGYRHAAERARIIAVADEIGPQWLPDTDEDPPVPRFLASFIVTVGKD